MFVHTVVVVKVGIIFIAAVAAKVEVIAVMVIKVVSVIAAVAQAGVVAASSTVKVGAVGVVLKPAEQVMSSNVANEVEIVSLH